jgi:hypothetical protein
LLRHDRERFLATGSGQDDKAFASEDDSQHLSVVAVIVHDQNACRVAGGVGARVHVRAR